MIRNNAQTQTKHTTLPNTTEHTLRTKSKHVQKRMKHTKQK